MLLAILGGGVFAAEPVPTLAQSGPGRFEVAAIDATVAHAATAAAEEAWRMLAAPLALPEAFSSPVFVRIVAESDATASPFNVAVEPGGVVSLRLRWTGTPVPVVRRALVQALLMRLAVAQHGVSARLTVPLWLEHACVGVWQTRADAAQLDALKQESARLPAPPAMAALLAWQRGGEEPRAWIAGSAWLLTILQSESGRDREWLGALRRMLGGEPADAALAATFGENFSNLDERELWWQTAWHQAVRARTLPTLEPADSRAQLAALARFVFAGAEDDDAVVPLGEVLARTSEPIVAVELKRRATDLERLVPALHPFYRNAGLSLAAVFNSRPARSGELIATFEADWRDATELEAASAAALDGIERSQNLVPAAP
jgi:hypothetical protein